MLGAIRRASSRVRSSAAARPLLEIDVGERLPPGVADDEEAPPIQLWIRRLDGPGYRHSIIWLAASLRSPRATDPSAAMKKLPSKIPDFFRTFVRNP